MIFFEEVKTMEYTVNQLAQISGVSTRALRYYHQIGLLTPKRISSTGYRIYGTREVDRLQQILFYKEMGMSLEDIGKILNSPDFNRLKALKEHKERLMEKRMQLDMLIENVKKTIESAEGRMDMSDKEKFYGFKKQLLEQNEKEYGKETRERDGEKTVEESNRKFMSMSEEDFNKMQAVEKEMIQAIQDGMAEKDPGGEAGQRAARLHKEWLGFYWPSYSKEAHAGLARMYTEDERFKAYYDKIRPGAAEFLRDAILIFTGK
jgi:DNA-binding transcriptional MerR regulator